MSHFACPRDRETARDSETESNSETEERVRNREQGTAMLTARATRAHAHMHRDVLRGGVGDADRRREAEHGIANASALRRTDGHASLALLDEGEHADLVEVEFPAQFVRFRKLRFELLLVTVLHVHVFLLGLLQRNPHFCQERVQFRRRAVLPNLELGGNIIRMFHSIVKVPVFQKEEAELGPRLNLAAAQL